MTEDKPKQTITLEELADKILDVCYTRHLCKSLEINYMNVTSDDVQKAREYVLSMYRVENKYEEKLNEPQN